MIVYSVCCAGGVVTSAGGGLEGVTAAMEVVSTTGLVGSKVGATRLFVAGSAVVFDAVFSFRQPCISKAMRPIPWTARTKKTAILTLARPLFFCSRREPCGISGLWLFMSVNAVASFHF